MNERNENSQAIEEFRGDRSALTAVGEEAQTRAIAEVQAAMVIAQRFPRDYNIAFQKIMVACSRFSLADKAMWSFPRGGEKITGPSIRLAEVLAQAWGNITCGVQELENRIGSSVVRAFAHDLESNTRVEKTFVVKHERSARGIVQKLSDPRDIYEMTANQGSRRLRACILAVIPPDVVEEAMKKCRETVAKGDGAMPMVDRVRKVVGGFAKYGITVEMLEKRLGHAMSVTTGEELADLRAIGQSIEDGAAKPGDYFAVESKATKLDDLTAKMAKPVVSPAPPPPTSAPTKEELSADEKLLAEPDPVFALDGDEVEPGADLNEPPPFDDEPPKRAKKGGWR